MQEPKQPPYKKNVTVTTLPKHGFLGLVPADTKGKVIVACRCTTSHLWFCAINVQGEGISKELDVIVREMKNTKGIESDKKIIIALKSIALKSICTRCTEKKHNTLTKNISKVEAWKQCLRESQPSGRAATRWYYACQFSTPEQLLATLLGPLFPSGWNGKTWSCLGPQLNGRCRYNVSSANHTRVELLAKKILELLLEVNQKIDTELLRLYSSMLCVKCYYESGEDDVIIHSWKRMIRDGPALQKSSTDTDFLEEAKKRLTDEEVLGILRARLHHSDSSSFRDKFFQLATETERLLGRTESRSGDGAGSADGYPEYQYGGGAGGFDEDADD